MDFHALYLDWYRYRWRYQSHVTPMLYVERSGMVWDNVSGKSDGFTALFFSLHSLWSSVCLFVCVYTSDEMHPIQQFDGVTQLYFMHITGDAMTFHSQEFHFNIIFWRWITHRVAIITTTTVNDVVQITITHCPCKCTSPIVDYSFVLAYRLSQITNTFVDIL